MDKQENLAIKAQNISKEYSRIDPETHKPVFFNALKNVSFDLPKGEILGIIGRNGSGKSTLLRVLSGITKPSKGKVELCGTVASILDVGTGFHPDLSGRENIYMRGQMLGMDRQVIDKVYDQLVEFSEIDEFVESPVKHLSSGMFLRLAFSIIIYLSADVLILDEVMAVGDPKFRQKCTDRLAEIVTSGRTVVMVSHDMRSIMDLCTHVALLHKGEIIKYGNPLSIVSDSDNIKLAGLQETGPGSDRVQSAREVSFAAENGFELLSVKTGDGSEEPSTNTFDKSSDINIEIEYRIKRPGIHFGMIFTDFLSNHLLFDSPKFHGMPINADSVGNFKAQWTIPGGLLNAGKYYINIQVFNDQIRPIRKYTKVVELWVDDRTLTDQEKSIYRAPISAPLNFRFTPINSFNKD